MTAIADPQAAFRPFLSRIAYTLRRKASSRSEAPEDTRARRDFIHEMITARPEAFQSEHDVQCMLQMYPGRF